MTPVVLLGASLLDVALGDPRWWPHPVRLMGHAISLLESASMQWASTPRGQRFAGIAVAFLLPAVASMAGWSMIRLAGAVHSGLGTVVELWLAATTLAGRDLSDHITAVEQALEDSLATARCTVARIVGRDTGDLSEEEILRATVESTGESVSDGIIAPLLYLALGGAPLALAYKAINTLDSMIGHRTPRHVHFGWASAKLDDCANWIPARATAWLLVMAGALQTGSLASLRYAAAILRRDGHQHPSPNAGRPEAAMAGVLGVQLGGTNYYDGVPEERPPLGEPLRRLCREDLTRARHLMWLAYGMGVMTLTIIVGWSTR